jgi:hypothetical protein
MDDPRIRLAHDSLTLLSAAERLRHGAGERTCASLLPDALGCIEQSLRALSGACQEAAHALIPPGGHDESIAWRYARAAADWPGARDGTGPSHERQAQLLATLHDTATALHAAAERCARARELVTATMDMPAGFTDREHPDAAPIAA